MANVVVVGGGIAGLIAARGLASDHTVMLLEAEPRVGGKLLTTTLRGRPLDLGPDAFITRNDAAEALCRSLGLGDALVAPATSGAAVATNDGVFQLPGRLAIGIPTDLSALRDRGVISRHGRWRARLDQISPRRIAPKNYAELARSAVFDPSVAAIVEGRLGREICDVLVDPLIGGINASDIHSLSFAAALPQFVERVAGKRGLMAALRPLTATHQQRDGELRSPAFLGLTGGMELLVDRLAADCVARGVRICLNRPVSTVTQDGNDPSTWSVSSPEENFVADAVVMATPAYVTASLLRCSESSLVANCAAIPYASVAMVTGAWEKSSAVSQFAGGPFGAGVLVRRRGGRLITAASCTSAKWPHSANKDEIVIRTSVGRYGDERASALDDDALIAAVREDLRAVLGLQSAPVEVVVTRWPRAFPQYVTGHLARVANIEASARQLGTFAIAGAGYHGIGIPACIDSGERASAQINEVLARR